MMPIFTMSQQERVEKVARINQDIEDFIHQIRWIQLDGARAGSMCIDLELLQDWEGTLMALQASIGPLAWPEK